MLPEIDVVGKEFRNAATDGIDISNARCLKPVEGGADSGFIVDLLMPTFKLARPAWLVTSFILLRFDRRRALLGFISCLLAAFWALLPVLAL